MFMRGNQIWKEVRDAGRKKARWDGSGKEKEWRKKKEKEWNNSLV